MGLLPDETRHRLPALSTGDRREAPAGPKQPLGTARVEVDARLGPVAGDPSTIGGDAEDSPDVGSCGFVASGAECPPGDIETAVPASADNPDDVTVDEARDRPAGDRGSSAQAA